MKVLHVIPSVSPLRGGPSFMLRSMAKTLVEAGIQIDVATTDDNGAGRSPMPLGQPVNEDGVTYWYFPRQSHFYTFSWPLTRWLARHIPDYDVVHIHALFSYAAIPAAYYARRYHIPYIARPLGVLNRWGMQNRRSWLKKVSFPIIEKRIIEGAAVMHFTSEQEWTEAAEIGVRQKHVIIPNVAEIPNDFDQVNAGKFRAMHPELAGRLIILFISRIHPKKGLDLLLPAFANVQEKFPKVALVIAGDGESELKARLQREAECLGIATNTYWVGFLSGENKWAALRDADIFVLPSYSENFGIAVVEAMACGVPVIISDQVGIHREISEGKAGFVVSCDSPSLTNALNTLLTKAHLRTEMGNNGSRLSKTKFGPAIACRDLLDVYRQIAPTSRITFDRAVA
jgi:glycosyltransferase involved in cell wall biosynthesis